MQLINDVLCVCVCVCVRMCVCVCVCVCVGGGGGGGGGGICNIKHRLSCKFSSQKIILCKYFQST